MHNQRVEISVMTEHGEVFQPNVVYLVLVSMWTREAGSGTQLSTCKNSLTDYPWLRLPILRGHKRSLAPLVATSKYTLKYVLRDLYRYIGDPKWRWFFWIEPRFTIDVRTRRYTGRLFEMIMWVMQEAHTNSMSNSTKANNIRPLEKKVIESTF